MKPETAAATAGTAVEASTMIRWQRKVALQ
jgi:hypothetical protein